MNKILLVICCFLTLTILNSQESHTTKIDLYLTEGVANGFSGSVLIYGDDQIILNKGYGLANKEESIQNSFNTVFDIGSNTKQFTSAAILILEEKGLISIQDSISELFDDLPEDKQQITIHQLLTHTSGLQESIGRDFEMISEDLFFESVFNSSLLSSPGESFNYSNIGYSVLARIIEEVSGGSYEAFIKEHLFDKAGMDQTGYLLPKWETKSLAHGYNRNIMHQGTMISRYQEYGDVSWHLKGNGGLQSTNRDLLKWIEAIRSGVILSDAAVKKWTTPYVKEINNYYAYGWGVSHPDRGEKVVSHIGGNGAFLNVIIWHQNSGDLVIFSCNSSSPSLEQVPRELEKMLLDPNYTPPPIKKNPYYFLYSYIANHSVDQDQQLLDLLERDYSKSIGSPDLLNRMGYITMRQGYQEWPLKFFQLNTELFPDDGNVWDSLGEYYMMSEENEKAKKSFIKALELGVDNSCDWCQSSIGKLKQLVLN